MGLFKDIVNIPLDVFRGMDNFLESKRECNHNWQYQGLSKGWVSKQTGEPLKVYYCTRCLQETFK